MGVSRKTYTKTVSYWDCGFGHRHRDKTVAVICKKESTARKVRVMAKDDRGARNKEMVAYWLAGKSFKETSKHFKLSYGYTTEIIQRSREYYKAINSEWAYGLHLTTLRALKKYGINSYEEIKTLFEREFDFQWGKAIHYREWYETERFKVMFDYKIITYLWLRGQYNNHNL